MVSACAYDAEIVARAREIKVNGSDYRIIRVGKIYCHDTAVSASDLVHKTAGLAEKFVFGILSELRYLDVADLSVVV